LVSRSISECSKEALFRNPPISHTFGWAQFLISYLNQPHLYTKLVRLDFGNQYHNIPTPIVSISAYMARLEMKGPVVPYPFNKLYHSNGPCKLQRVNRQKSDYDQLWLILKQLYKNGNDFRTVRMISQLHPDLYITQREVFEDDWTRFVGILCQLESLICTNYMNFIEKDPNRSHPLSLLEARLAWFIIRDWYDGLPMENSSTFPFEEESISLIVAIVNTYFQSYRPSSSGVRKSITITSSSLIRLSEKAKNLQSLSLCGQNVCSDIYIVETNEYVSYISYPIQSYFTKKVCNALEALEAIMSNCSRLVFLDLSWCSWVAQSHISLIIQKAVSLRSVNLIKCSQLPNSLQRLFYFESTQELKDALSRCIPTEGSNDAQIPTENRFEPVLEAFEALDHFETILVPNRAA
jgi:hypothetical protein